MLFKNTFCLCFVLVHYIDTTDSLKLDIILILQHLRYFMNGDFILPPAGHKNQILIEETDLHTFLQENKIEENFCRKNSKSDVQMKFSCNFCRYIFDKFGSPALSLHLFNDIFISG